MKDLVELVLSSIPSAEDDNELPGDFDGWVFGIAAKAIVTMGDHEKPSSISFQNHDNGSLNELVFHTGNPEWSRLSVPFGNVLTQARLGTVAALVKSL